MFGYRSDGVRIKGLDPVQKIMPHIMFHRHDSQNSTRYELRCEPMDEFIRAQRDQGFSFNYMHIIAASIIRTYALYPRLNRFIMNGRLFARKGGIYLSFVVKKSLSAQAADSVVKLCFTGTESIYEVKEMIDEAIRQNNHMDATNKTDKTAKLFTCIPNPLIKFAVGLIKILDRHGIMPKAIINASPFHTSIWITNLKSIKGDYIYHHLYDFGTSGQFVAMGKEAMKPVVEGDKIIPGKVMNLGIVTDERFCDGFYYVTAFKAMKKFMSEPDSLKERLQSLTEDVEVKFKKKKKEKKKNKLTEEK